MSPTQNGTLRKMKIATAIAAFLTTTIGGGYAAVSWAEDYHAQFAQQDVVAVQFQQTKITILQSAIRDYEDQLFVLEFKISAEEATALDHAKKQQITRRLTDLQTQLTQLREPPTS